MAASGILKIDSFAFDISGIKVFKAGSIAWSLIDLSETDTLIDRSSLDDNLGWKIRFSIGIGAIKQCTTAGFGIANVLAALKGTTKPDFYPAYRVNGQLTTYQTVSYKVMLDQQSVSIASAGKSGIFDSYKTINLITQSPIYTLPQFLNF